MLATSSIVLPSHQSSEQEKVMVALDLNYNDSETLLRHALGFKPNTGDAREDRRLSDALSELAQALQEHINAYGQNSGSISSNA